MKSRLLGLIPYSLVLAVVFYLLPLFIFDTGSAMLMMLAGIPLCCLACGIVSGVMRGFEPLLL